MGHFDVRHAVETNSACTDSDLVSEGEQSGSFIPDTFSMTTTAGRSRSRSRRGSVRWPGEGRKRQTPSGREETLDLPESHADLVVAHIAGVAHVVG
jgi:hypothetical protein